MKSIARMKLRWLITSFILLALAGVSVYTAIMPKARADERSLAVGEHIITVHDDGQSKGFITKKQTLREALAEAAIKLDRNDRTEPNIDERLVANSYNVNIYRARTVVVKDGSQLTKIITSYRTGKQIVKQAGIAVRDEDILTLSQSNSPMRDSAAEVLSIKRAVPFNFDFYGKKATSYTQAQTIGEMLAEKHIKMSANDVIVPNKDIKIARGMNVRLYRNGMQTVTVDEDIQFETEQIKDVNRDKGYKEIQTKGVNGKRTVTYEINVQNGVEVSRREINSNIIQQPVKQVEVVGTKVSLPAGSHEDWMAAAGLSPSDYGYANYIFSNESGWRMTATDGTHYGLGQTSLSKLSSACPNWQTDPVCQIKVFNGYAVGRYGSWAGAYSAWQAKGWW
jgi:transglycosylase-like protein